MQHLGVNFGGIWMFELGLSGFLLRKFGLIFNLKVHWQHCRPLAASLRHVV